MSIARIFSRSIKQVVGLRQVSTDISQLFEESNQTQDRAVFQDDMRGSSQPESYGRAFPQPQRRMNKGYFFI